jgi:outer membrane lipoprotein-sorting protein
LRCPDLAAPPGFSHSYAHRVKVHLDLHQALIRQIEAWDANGEMIERIALEKIVPARFDDDTFNPKNPAYAF